MNNRRAYAPRGARTVLCALILGGGGCNEHPLKGVELQYEALTWTTVAEVPPRRLDVLFIIDNSGSMAEEQATLAANFDAFIEVLEVAAIDVRIGVTTTDNGNPLCSGGQGGAFVTSSCRSRLSDFVSSDEMADYRPTCTDACTVDEVQTLPTSVGWEDAPRPRPWIELRPGVRSNLADGVTPLEAFQCIAPQGVRGCGFESPLESMYKALRRTMDPSEAAYGFLRDDASLLVVIVTDELDCSARSEQWAAFGEGGVPSLWSGSGSPTSALCRNAGVRCSGQGPIYDDCWSEEIGLGGTVVDTEESVLWPVSRYVEFLQRIDEQNWDRGVFVGLLAGVPEHGAPVEYAVGRDAAFEADFGMAPGCEGHYGKAVPPVRLLEFSRAFAGTEFVDDNVFSVCSPDYTGALQTMAGWCGLETPVHCLPSCLRDTQPELEGLQPRCIGKQTFVDGSSGPVPQCLDLHGHPELPEGQRLCFALDRTPLGRAPCDGTPQVEVLRDPDNLPAQPSFVRVSCRSDLAQSCRW